MKKFYNKRTLKKSTLLFILVLCSSCENVSSFSALGEFNLDIDFPHDSPPNGRPSGVPSSVLTPSVEPSESPPVSKCSLDQLTLSVDKANFKNDEVDQVQTVAVKMTDPNQLCSWNFWIDQTWAEFVSSPTGEGNGSFQYQVKDKNDGPARVAVFRLENGDYEGFTTPSASEVSSESYSLGKFAKKMLIVLQEAPQSKCSVTFKSQTPANPIAVDGGTGSLNFSLKGTDCHWNYTLTDSSEMISNPLFNQEEGSLTYKVQATSSLETRSAQIDIRSNDTVLLSKTLVQSPVKKCQLDQISVSPESKTLSYNDTDTDSFTVKTKEDCIWNFVSNRNWLLLSEASGRGEGKVYFKALTQNVKDSVREALVRLENSDISSFKVIQNFKNCTASLRSSSTVSIGRDGGAATFLLDLSDDPNCKWIVKESALESDQSYFKETLQFSSGNKNDSLTVAAEKNATGEPKEVFYSIYDGTNSEPVLKNLSVFQDGSYVPPVACPKNDNIPYIPLVQPVDRTFLGCYLGFQLQNFHAKEPTTINNEDRLVKLGIGRDGNTVSYPDGIFALYSENSEGIPNDIRLSVDFSTFFAPDTFTITPIPSDKISDAVNYAPVMNSCNKSTFKIKWHGRGIGGPSQCDPGGPRRPCQEQIRQTVTPIVPRGTKALVFNFKSVSTKTYLQVKGLCGFTVPVAPPREGLAGRWKRTESPMDVNCACPSINKATPPLKDPDSCGGGIYLLGCSDSWK